MYTDHKIEPEYTGTLLRQSIAVPFVIKANVTKSKGSKSIYLLVVQCYFTINTSFTYMSIVCEKKDITISIHLCGLSLLVWSKFTCVV